MMTSNEDAELSIGTSGLNIILCACAEGGLVDRGFAAFGDLTSSGAVPNADSFSFLMESLASNMLLIVKSTTKGEQHMSCSLDSKGTIETADFVFRLAQEMECEVSPDLLHHYLRVLAYSGNPDRSLSVLRTFHTKFNEPHAVLKESYVQVFRQCELRGEEGMMRDVSELMIQAGYRIPRKLKK